MSKIETIDEQRPFEIGELFYSRTDGRGVITAGNDVFCRIAGYEHTELMGAPHRIIRHSDMPRGVFWLLWDRIRKGLPTAAYVKNRASDGRYYWVLANVTPVDGGYFSVRLKPSSDVLVQVQELYSDLLSLEADKGLEPSGSAALLLERLAGMGFKEYDEFSAAALCAEVSARAAALGREDDRGLDGYRSIARAVKRVEVSAGEVAQTFASIRMLPSNMRIIATRLEPTGGPVSTIAVNYSAMARDMERWVQAFLDSEDSGFSQMRRTISRTLYLASAARLQLEAAATLCTGDPGQETESRWLTGLAEGYEAAAVTALAELAASARRLGSEQAEMKRYVTGLASTRTLCRVENARLTDDDGALDGIIDSLDEFQGAIDSQLSCIDTEIRMIRNQIDFLLGTSAGLPRRPHPGCAAGSGARVA